MCNVDRDIEMGYCNSSNNIKINISQLHHWEEPPISGTNGSGTIFFSNCNMSCVFCQNYTISQMGNGNDCTPRELVNLMISLEQANAHNINLVTPTHFSLQIKTAIEIAKNEGLTIPIVWNSNSYENVETLKSLEGTIDIYLADLKYNLSSAGLKYSNSKDYPTIAKNAIKEMYRQVGHLKIFEEIAFRGIMIRILLLPNDTNDIKGTLEWIADNLGLKTHVSLMGQYYPTYNASNFIEINKTLDRAEYESALELIEKMGFENYYIQEVGSDKSYTPKFSK